MGRPVSTEPPPGPWVDQYDGATRPDQPLIEYSVGVMGEELGARYAGYARVTVRAGPRGSEHVVPPAGEEHAYDRILWARSVEVSVSPTGRSARVWVDGVEIPTSKETPTDG